MILFVWQCRADVHHSTVSEVCRMVDNLSKLEVGSISFGVYYLYSIQMVHLFLLLHALAQSTLNSAKLNDSKCRARSFQI